MSAIQQRLTDHFDIWMSADTEKKAGRGRSSGNAASVYGIKKLRELILELAVRGKLVPQYPNDEPASELVKKIQAEKTKLISEGKIKKEKPLPPVSDEEKSFDLPDGWEWARLTSFVLESSAGWSPSCESNPREAANWGVLKVSAVSWGKFLPEENKALPSNLEPRKDCEVSTGDFLVSRANTAELVARSIVVEDAPKNLMMSDKIIRLNLAELCDKKFVNLVNGCATSRDYYMRIAGGTSSSMKNVSREQILNLVVAVPPTNEQHRIVAKVDELMALCDQLESQHNNAAEAHEKLVSQLLATLTQSQCAEDFSENWQRIAAHFDTLFTTEASIDALKQTLLQLAVMGKLVPQNPEDEPASELLKKIQAEKVKLITEGKIRKDKPVAHLADDEKPFDLPANWDWVRLADLVALVTDGDHQAPPRAETGVPFLVIGNLNTGRVLIDGCRFVPEEYYKNLDWGKKPVNNDILYTVTGSYGIPIKVNTLEKFCVQRHVAILKTTNSTPVNYLNLLLKSKYALQFASDIATGTAQKTVPITGLRMMSIATPPEAEQHRIVAKADELMTLCDQLKSRLIAANQLQQKLADVFVETALNAESRVTIASSPSRDDARALLGAEIIHQLYNEKTFGQVKLQKLVHLCEYIAGVDAAAGEYQRFAAGPHDPELIADIESTLQSKEWYEEYSRDKFGHAYRPLKNAGQHRKQMGEYWQDKLPIIQKLIDLTRKWDTERCEIFSTLYAAWNDLLILGKPISDEAILSEVLERWHKRKTNISKKTWLENLEWLRNSDFIPTGTGRPTRSESLFE